MFANPTYTVGALQRVVATLVACALVLTSVVMSTTAQAANLTNISDTLSDSDLSVTSAHTLAFTIPTGSALGTTATITIDFGGNFTGVNTVVGGDVTLTVNGGAATFAGFAATANTISFTSNTAATAGQEVIVAIADGKITNPAVAQSYEITVNTGTAGDSGQTRVAIIDNVLVTAAVDTNFVFTISGLATSTNANGTTTTGSTTATTIPFGVLTAGTVYTMAQQLNVTTNAKNGFVVTVEQDADLLSSTGANIDSFINGNYLNTPAAWQAPGGTLGNVNEYGHWGLTSDDGDLNGNEFGTSLYVAASTTPREVFSHTAVSDGTTQDIGKAIVGYTVQITSLQEAADDYNTTLTYIATPTF